MRWALDNNDETSKYFADFYRYSHNDNLTLLDVHDVVVDELKLFKVCRRFIGPT